MITGHGDDRYQFPYTIRVDFSSNICADTDNTAIKAHLVRTLALLDTYPEPEPFTLERERAEQVGISPRSILVTAGATDAIYAVAHAFHDKYRSLIPGAAFSEYGDACQVYGMPLRLLPVMSDAGRLLSTARERHCLWICNPNNPDGSFIDRRAVLQMADAHPDHLFVIDLSYAAYCRLPSVNDTDAAERPNLLLIRSLTKQFKLPGLRLGWIVGSENLIDAVRVKRMPWVVNTPAIEAGRFVVNNRLADTKSPHLEELLAETAYVREVLEGIGIEVQPSVTHYLLCRLPVALEITAADLKLHLLKEHGLLIRDASNFSFLTPYHFRIAVQGRDRDNLLLQALADLSKSRRGTLPDF